MTEIRVNDHTLLLLPDTEVQIEHLSPLFQDGIEDSFSLPVTVPVRGNELALEHSQELAIADRKTLFTPAYLSHNGVLLHPGDLKILGSGPESLYASFSVDGLVTELKDKKIPELLAGIEIDLMEEINDLPIGDQTIALDTLADTGTPGLVLANRKLYRAGGDCHFPQHYNEKLYGESNPSWFKKGKEFKAGGPFTTNDLVEMLEFTPLKRTFTWQCLEDTTGSPVSAPDLWRRVAYGIVNAWDGETGYFQFNNLEQGNAFSLVPWFYVKWVMDKAFASLGYSVVGDFMSDRSTDEMIMPNSATLDVTAPTNNLYYFRVAHEDTVHYGGSGPQPFILPSSIESPTPYQDTENLWDPALSHFTCPAEGTWRFKVKITCAYMSQNVDRSPRAWLYIIDENDIIKESAQGYVQRPHYGPSVFQFVISAPLAATDIGHPFRFHMRLFNLNAGNVFDSEMVWPLNSADIYSTVEISGDLLQERPDICTPSTTIVPAMHVPDVNIGEWLIALSEVFNFKIDPDPISRTIRLDYRERIAQNLNTYTRDETQRCLSPIMLDHQRVNTGYTLKYEMEDKVPDGTTIDPATQRFFSEIDLPRPISLGQTALLLSTRKYLISRYDTTRFDFYWQETGYYLPDIKIGDGSKVVSPAVKLLHMEQFHVKGHQYLMPVLDELGTSAFFGDQGDRSRIYLCEYKASVSDDGDVTGVPSARSWGFGWNEGDRSQRSLVLYDQNIHLPGLYPQQWMLWLDLMVHAEPVHMDLQVDPPFLLSKAWQEPFLMRSQRFLVQQMPLTYPNFPGPLISTGVQALKVRRGAPPQFAISLQAEVPVVPSALRRRVLYVHRAAHFEFRYEPSALGAAITAFNVDGVDHVTAEILTESEDNYIIVGSADYHTNIIDALNALDVPDFQFDPYEALPANGGHGQYMAITYPVALNWRIEFRIGYQYYRYTSAGLMTRTYGPGDTVPDWEEPFNYDGTEALPTLCEDLPTLPPAYVYPDPALRRCTFYQDINPYFRLDIASTIRVLHFTSNGVDHTYAEDFLAETDNRITVGGEDWYTNLVDLLNRMNVPYFAFAPIERPGTPGYPNTHGGFMTITYPIGYSWSIELDIGGWSYRYTASGLETWSGTAWEPVYNYGGYEQDPHDCQDL